MHPVISIGFYLIAQCIALFLAYWCVKHTRNWTSGSRTFRKVLKVLIILFIVFLMLPVLGAMLPDSGFKFLLQAAGNIWLGFDVYFCGSLWIFGIICGMLQQVLGHGKRAFWAAPILYLSLAVKLNTPLSVISSYINMSRIYFRLYVFSVCHHLCQIIQIDIRNYPDNCDSKKTYYSKNQIVMIIL